MKKATCAFSGGVDSSAAALLLKKAGFETELAYMKLKKSESIKSVKEAAKKLGLPLKVFDFSREFEKRIIEYFLKEHKMGRTPNPCVVCNKEIKFGLLMEKLPAKSYLATGHYARLEEKDGILRIFQAKDREKDQSYFLWKLGQKQLRRTLFPLGGKTKKEARSLLEKKGISLLEKRESMEICFIPETAADFLKKSLKPDPGYIVSKRGERLGRHRGLFFYTIGQRKAIELPGGPFYVLKKDLKKNLLIVTKNEKDLYGRGARVGELNWISGRKPDFPLKARARIRYRQKFFDAEIFPSKKGECEMVFKKPQKAVTPGQSAAFYKRKELLGGGTIKS